MMTETQTMLIRTLNFGELEIPESKILTFKEGLPGFAQIHKFAILELEDVRPFQYLQAIGDPPIALLIVNPFLVFPGFQYKLSGSDMEDVCVSDSSQVAVYVVATIPSNPENATVNLMAPIVLNEKKGLGKQIIMHESGYSVKHSLLESSRQG